MSRTPSYFLLAVATVLSAYNPASAQSTDPATQLYVNRIGVNFAHVGGPKRQPFAVVDVVDGNGQPVNGALVVGDWSGCFRQRDASELTDTVCTTIGGEPMDCLDGRAVIWGKSHTCRGKNCLFTFTITSVQKDGMTYIPVDGKTSGGMWCDVFNIPTAYRATKATLTSSRKTVTRTQQMPTRRLARWWRR